MASLGRVIETGERIAEKVGSIEGPKMSRRRFFGVGALLGLSAAIAACGPEERRPGSVPAPPGGEPGTEGQIPVLEFRYEDIYSFTLEGLPVSAPTGVVPRTSLATVTIVRSPNDQIHLPWAPEVQLQAPFLEGDHLGWQPAVIAANERIVVVNQGTSRVFTPGLDRFAAANQVDALGAQIQIVYGAGENAGYINQVRANSGVIETGGVIGFEWGEPLTLLGEFVEMSPENRAAWNPYSGSTWRYNWLDVETFSMQVMDELLGMGYAYSDPASMEIAFTEFGHPRLLGGGGLIGLQEAIYRRFGASPPENADELILVEHYSIVGTRIQEARVNWQRSLLNNPTVSQSARTDIFSAQRRLATLQGRLMDSSLGQEEVDYLMKEIYLQEQRIDFLCRRAMNILGPEGPSDEELISTYGIVPGAYDLRNTVFARNNPRLMRLLNGALDGANLIGTLILVNQGIEGLQEAAFGHPQLSLRQNSSEVIGGPEAINAEPKVSLGEVYGQTVRDALEHIVTGQWVADVESLTPGCTASPVGCSLAYVMAPELFQPQQVATEGGVYRQTVFAPVDLILPRPLGHNDLEGPPHLVWTTNIGWVVEITSGSPFGHGGMEGNYSLEATLVRVETDEDGSDEFVPLAFVRQFANGVITLDVVDQEELSHGVRIIGLDTLEYHLVPSVRFDDSEFHLEITVEGQDL